MEIRERLLRAALGLALSLAATGCPDSHWEDSELRFGFHASWTNPEGEDVAQAIAWTAGPHSRFADVGATRLASDALAWFSRARVAGHRSNAVLELAYRSGGVAVTAYHDADSTLPFGRQLEEWFECFPPDDDDLAEDGEVHWSASVVGRGAAHGSTGDEQAAMERLRALVSRHGRSPLLERASFGLARSFRRAERVTDVYTAEAGAAEIEELPARLREKLARDGR